MGEGRWRVRLGAAAELDFANILKWTAENFGARQSRVYRDTLVQAIGDLADGPDVAGAKPGNEIIPGLRTLHIARGGRRGSHFLMYRATPNSTIEIVRVLHDRMDLLAPHSFYPRREHRIEPLTRGPSRQPRRLIGYRDRTPS